MKLASILSTVSLFLVGVPSTSGGHTLSNREMSVLNDWLGRNPGFRLATPDDCGCPADIAALKAGLGGPWKPVPDYQPYLATGDFNGDTHRDFAVVVRSDSRLPSAWTLLVFNGGGATEPAFMDNSLDFHGLALFFGAPRPQPHRLVVGRFFSHGATLEPSGRSYRLDWEEE